ncbi:unnamed protein product [Pleuronectes platessa]|uniref:Uncharacterized protein n=1 Tax=Pleuronectes platessa TaxID=8262 RepID=A0A9N7TYJ4_PLEPL|nr:unnamed protein product [Pleuronectes platessa]
MKSRYEEHIKSIRRRNLQLKTSTSSWCSAAAAAHDHLLKSTRDLISTPPGRARSPAVSTDLLNTRCDAALRGSIPAHAAFLLSQRASGAQEVKSTYFHIQSRFHPNSSF